MAARAIEVLDADGRTFSNRSKVDTNGWLNMNMMGISPKFNWFVNPLLPKGGFVF
jgi:hypothetical protein